MTLASIILAAAAAATDGDGIVAKGSLVVGSSVVTAIITYFTAKRHAEKTAIPQPCTVEQSGYQAKMKENDKAHENLFNRMSAVEKQLAAVDAKVDAKFDSITEQLRETKEMVRQLFDRICGGKRK